MADNDIDLRGAIVNGAFAIHGAEEHAPNSGEGIVWQSGQSVIVRVPLWTGGDLIASISPRSVLLIASGGDVFRVFNLPAVIDPQATSAVIEAGQLTITLPIAHRETSSGTE